MCRVLLAGCFDVPLWFRSHFIWNRSLILIEIRLLSRQFSHAMCNGLVRGNLSQHDLLSCFNVGVITRWLMSDNKEEQASVRRAHVARTVCTQDTPWRASLAARGLIRGTCLLAASSTRNLSGLARAPTD